MVHWRWCFSRPCFWPGFNNRLNANWKLLLQIAQHAGGGWPEQACRSAIYLSRAPYEPSVGVQLLAVLRSMFTKNRTEITSEQVVQELLADPNSPWHEYRGRGPITKNQVAASLRDYDIRPVVVHPTKRADFSRHGYRAAQFEDAFARFLPARAEHPNTQERAREDVMFGCSDVYHWMGRTAKAVCLPDCGRTCP